MGRHRHDYMRKRGSIKSLPPWHMCVHAFSLCLKLWWLCGVQVVSVLAIVQVCVSSMYQPHWTSGRPYQKKWGMWRLLGEGGERLVYEKGGSEELCLAPMSYFIMLDQ